MKNVLVVGGTGQVGSMIVSQLRDKGYNVYVMIYREESRAKVPVGVNVVWGDLTEPSSLNRVTIGMDLIVATATTFDSRFSEGYRTLLAEAKKGLVEHILYVSNVPRIEPLLPMFTAKKEVENILSGGSIPCTILKAEPFLGYVVNSMITPAVEAGYPVGLFANKGRHYWIAEQDVAAFAVAMIDNVNAYDKTFTIGGELPLTFSEVVSRYEVLNKVSVATSIYSEPPPGMPSFIFDIVAQLFEYNSNKPDQVANQFGVTLTHPDVVITK